MTVPIRTTSDQLQLARHAIALHLFRKCAHCCGLHVNGNILLSHAESTLIKLLSQLELNWKIDSPTGKKNIKQMKQITIEITDWII